MKIYSTRHGETQWNLENKIVGVTDLPLTHKGIEQAKKLAEYLKEKGDINLIVTSPMQRAKQTAMYAANAIGAELIVDERLREWDYGSFEGLDRYADGFYENKRQFATKMRGNGESLLQLAHRVYSALDEIIEKHNDKNVLLVSHGGVCRVIETYFNDMSTDDFSAWFMGNCQLIEYSV